MLAERGRENRRVHVDAVETPHVTSRRVPLSAVGRRERIEFSALLQILKEPHPGAGRDDGGQLQEVL